MDVPADTVAIEPRFAAVDVAHVDEIGKRRIFRRTITADDEHMFGCHGDGNGVVERSRSGIGTPVDGIDADTGSGYDGLDETHVLDGIITDGDVRVQFTLRRTDMRTKGVLRSELIAHDICSHQLVEGLVRHVFEQFDHRQTALTETGYDERTGVIALGEERVKRPADIVHRQTRTMVDRVFVAGEPSVDRRMAVERRIEAVSG